MKKRSHLIVSGRVQGVCFRMDSADRARHLGLTGWVRNRPDGTVEIVAEGNEKDLAEFRKWCHRGPAFAHVTSVKEEPGDASGEFDDFAITR